MGLDYLCYGADTFETVCNLFDQTRDINYVVSQFPEFYYNDILSILAESNRFIGLLDPCELTVDDKKVIFISDTHYGSIYDNPKYADLVFNFAKWNSINTIFHGGDIIEGIIISKRRFDSNEQAEYFLENYPSDKDIITYAILGNHDYMAIRDSQETLNILNSRDDINILGFKKTYFNWKSEIVGLQHEIKKYRLNFPFSSDGTCFKGHSHCYRVRSFSDLENIYIPALCDDTVARLSQNTPGIKDENALKPGFLVAEHFGDYIVITNYFFNEKSIVKGTEHVKKLIKTSY